MNKQLKISQLTRKRIAQVLLLNFFVSTILVAFPHSHCDGMCSLDQKTHQCSDMEEMSCCDMMDMNDTNSSSPCGTELTESSCDYELGFIDNLTFVIPKTVESKIIFVEISIIPLDVEQNISNFFILSQNVIPDISPPIYLTISSFLI